MLLQGTVLPQQLYLAKEPLPPINTLLAAPVQHAHEEMTFEEPENREGEAFPRQRTLHTKNCWVIFSNPTAELRRLVSLVGLFSLSWVI